MPPAYRLADALKFSDAALRQQMKEHYPDSIAADYITRTDSTNNMDVLGEVIKSKCKQYDHKPTEVAVHLRLGDVVCGDARAEKALRPATVEELRATIDQFDIPREKKLTIFSGNHVNKCVDESRVYLDSAVTELGANIAEDASADEHFCRMVNAEYFVQGRGGFSELLSQTRKHLGFNYFCDDTISHAVAGFYPGFVCKNFN